ncbi:MAG: hypothetical protein D3923_04450 [Candidatus Electrothrix sp. AR3]|nr:hypothetical protein [Candidatus Electrothrix sp. AR3]
MGRDWPEREPRPKVKKLSKEEKATIQKSLENGIQTSPVLTALQYRVRSARGRFYYEQYISDSECFETIARVTPLVTPEHILLLETAYEKGRWGEITQGEIEEIINALSGDIQGTFHGLGALDHSIRVAQKAKREKLTILRNDHRVFSYADSGSECGVQEILFHYFGVPIAVIAEPRECYAYHRTPHIREIDEEQQRILVDFLASSRHGESFGDTVLYLKKDEIWELFMIKPNQSQTITSSMAWLEKRDWKEW